MKNKLRICVITGTRAEYGLLKPVLTKISESNDLELQILVTGMHLLPEFGYTCEDIKEDGFDISAKVPIIVGGDAKSSMATSIGVGIISMTQAIDILDPDIVLI